jgi:hypothetical protein
VHWNQGLLLAEADRIAHSTAMGSDSLVKFVRRAGSPKKLWKAISKGLFKERQQVAAVCYRRGKRGVEFLLVQSRGGRWISLKAASSPT